MSIFSNWPGDPDPVEYPCECCGNDPCEGCICPECPECGECGNPDCYIPNSHSHGLVRTEEQAKGLAALDRYLIAEAVDDWWEIDHGDVPLWGSIELEDEA